MRKSFVDAHIAVQDHVFSLGLDDPFSFNLDTAEDNSAKGLGVLTHQNDPFFLFDVELLDSYRAGPSFVSPTRYPGVLTIAYLTKEPSTVLSYKRLEKVAKEFWEQTISGVRFRTFTPHPTNDVEGFTSYAGEMNFDFELYRGGNP